MSLETVIQLSKRILELEEELAKLKSNPPGKAENYLPVMPDTVNLQGMRKEARLSVREVSKTTGINPAYLRRMELGEIKILPSEKVKRLIDFYISLGVECNLIK